MKIDHLSDCQIQECALNETQEQFITQHIQTCSHCRARVEVYRQLIIGIREQPLAAFDFDLTGSVMSTMPVRTHHNSDARFFWIVAITGVAVLLISGYLFWNYLVGLFPGTSYMTMYFAVTGATALFLFQGIDMVRKYKRQIEKMNLDVLQH